MITATVDITTAELAVKVVEAFINSSGYLLTGNQRQDGTTDLKLVHRSQIKQEQAENDARSSDIPIPE